MLDKHPDRQHCQRHSLRGPSSINECRWSNSLVIFVVLLLPPYSHHEITTCVTRRRKLDEGFGILLNCYLARWVQSSYVYGSRTRPGIIVVSRYLFFLSSVWPLWPSTYHFQICSIAISRLCSVHSLSLLFVIAIRHCCPSLPTFFCHCFSTPLCAVASSSVT